MSISVKNTKASPAQSTGVVEHIDCISAKGYDSSNECHDYEIKQSDGEAPALEIPGMWSPPSLPLIPGPL